MTTPKTDPPVTKLEVLQAAVARGYFVKEDANQFGGKAGLCLPSWDAERLEIDPMAKGIDHFTALSAGIDIEDGPIVGAARVLGMGAEVQSFDGETARVRFTIPVGANIN